MSWAMGKWLIAAGIAAFVAFAWLLLPSPPDVHDHGRSAPMREEAQGLVLTVDPAAASMTIRHGPLATFGMGPMTMEFRVRNSAELGRLKPGDEIAFSVESADGALVVTGWELVR